MATSDEVKELVGQVASIFKLPTDREKQLLDYCYSNFNALPFDRLEQISKQSLAREISKLAGSGEFTKHAQALSEGVRTRASEIFVFETMVRLFAVEPRTHIYGGSQRVVLGTIISGGPVFLDDPKPSVLHMGQYQRWWRERVSQGVREISLDPENLTRRYYPTTMNVLGKEGFADEAAEGRVVLDEISNILNSLSSELSNTNEKIEKILNAMDSRETTSSDISSSISKEDAHGNV